MFEDMKTQQARRAQNQAELLKSKILAKAVCQKPDGSIFVLAVYEKSTTYEFYWTHKVNSKSKRAPRKKWAIAGYTVKKNHESFIRFVDNFALHNKAQVLSCKVINKKKLAAIMIKAYKDSLGTNWYELPRIATPADVKYVNQKFRSKTRGSVVVGWGR